MGRTAWILFSLVVVAVALVSRLLRCGHRQPLALLPPSTDAHGHRLPARWFCADCGHTWNAGLERDTAPIPRFTGYDETKLIAARKRADELANRHRESALRRAGQWVPAEKRPKAAPARREPVPIHGRRIAG